MTDSNIRPGTLVWYAAKGLGRVKELHGSPSVLFWSDEKSGATQNIPPALLTLISSDSKPDETAGELDGWARKSPLKLVALALLACGGTGTDSDIREKLNGRAPLSPNWGGWWNRTRTKLSNLPSHFRINETAGVTEYTLLSGVADVPPDWSEPRSASVSDWKKWLSSSAHEHPPGRFPPRPVAEVLAKWPESTIDQTLLRVALAAEELSSAGDISPQVAEGWLRAVALAALRQRETGGQDSRGYLAARVGELLARLSRIAGDGASQDLVLQAGALEGDTDAWRRGFVAGMWEAFEGDDAREMYRKSSAVLGRQARAGLARQIALAAFDPGYSSRRNSELDRLLDMLPEDQRIQILQEMVAFATPGQKDGVLDYMANSRHASGPEHLDLRMMAVLALANQGTDSAKLEGTLQAGEPDFNGVLGVSNPQPLVQNIQEDHNRKMESLQQSLSFEIEREYREKERLQKHISRLDQQVQALDSELSAHREESRLEIRQDILLAVGEVLQSVFLRDRAEEMTGSVEAGLTLALQAGGAELLEKPGDTVNYRHQWHLTKDHLIESATVRVLAPGVIVRGGIHGDKVLLKAHVRHEAG